MEASACFKVSLLQYLHLHSKDENPPKLRNRSLDTCVVELAQCLERMCRHKSALRLLEYYCAAHDGEVGRFLVLSSLLHLKLAYSSPPFMGEWRGRNIFVVHLCSCFYQYSPVFLCVLQFQLLPIMPTGTVSRTGAILDSLKSSLSGKCSRQKNLMDIFVR